MIKHVVMWRLKDSAEGNDKSRNSEVMVETLQKLESVIAEIATLEVGKNQNTSDAAYDLVLISTHEDHEALNAYIKHPAHQEAAFFIGKVVAERSVVDFEY